MEQQKELAGPSGGYAAKVRTNYRYNYPFGIMQGFFFFAGMGLYNFNTIFPAFVYDLTASSAAIGIMGSVGHFSFSAAQIFGMAAIEHLSLKKSTLLRFGLYFRLTWLVIGLLPLFLPPSAAIAAVVAVYAVGQFMNGMYILGFFDFMSKVIPIEKRGAYFGFRNALALASQAGAGYLAGSLVAMYSYSGGVYQTPRGYTFCFILASLVHLIDLWALSRFKEEPAPSVGKKESVINKLRTIPELLRTDVNYARYCFLRPLVQLGFVVSPFLIIYAKLSIDGVGEKLGIFTAANLVAMAMGSYFWGRVADRITFKRVMELSAILIGVTFFGTYLLKSHNLFLVFYFLFGFVSSGLMLSIDNLNMEFGPPEKRPTYMATTNVVSGVVMSVAPIVVGVLATRFPYRVIFTASGIIMIVMAVALNRLVADPRKTASYNAAADLSS